jgi:peptide/nickel transport system ATP-binding protein
MEPEAAPPVLEAEDLRKVYRQRRGLLAHSEVIGVDGVSFSVKRGQTVALLGESGCGKSTVGRLLLDLTERDGGSIRLDGRPLEDMDAAERRAYRRSVQMVFQNPLSAFNPMLTVGDSLRDAMRLRDDLDRRARDARAAQLLERVRLPRGMITRYPSEMSGGQLQRVGIARALASEPSVVFLDEPTSALDMSVRGQVLELLRELQRETRAGYVLVSHDIRVVRALADEVLVMYLGHVVEEGPAREVLARPLHPYTRGLIATALRTDGQIRTRVRGEALHLDPGYEGCRFYPRCPYRLDQCREPQRLAERAPGHRVRCWRALDIEHQPPPLRPAPARSKIEEVEQP